MPVLADVGGMSPVVVSHRRSLQRRRSPVLVGCCDALPGAAVRGVSPVSAADRMWGRPGIGEDSDEVRGQPSAGADVVVLGPDVGWGESSPGAGARSGDLVKTWRRCGRNRGGAGRRRGGAGRGGEAHVSAMIETTMSSGTCSPRSMSTLLRQAPLMIFIALIDAIS